MFLLNINDVVILVLVFIFLFLISKWKFLNLYFFIVKKIRVFGEGDDLVDVKLLKELKRIVGNDLGKDVE